jgi:hypothetical protein
VKHFVYALIGASALALTTSVYSPAEAQDRTRVGVLDCDVSGGIGMIIGSRKAMNCTFTRRPGAARGLYRLDRQIRARCRRNLGRTHGMGGLCADRRRSGRTRGHLCGCGGGRIGRGGAWRQCAGRRFEPDDRAAAAVGAGADRLNLAVGVAALTLNPVR